ncbi:MAG: cellulose biosynthesis protein BcsS, partial [Brevundimonas sp.]
LAWVACCVGAGAPGPANPAGFASAAMGEDQTFALGAQRRLAERPGGAWAVRLSAAAARYDYESSGQQIDGRFAPVQALAVREWYSGPRYAAVGLGPRYVRTRLTPDDPGNDRQGSQLDAVVTAETGWYGATWRAQVYGEYGVDQRAHYVRADARRRIRGPWRAGGEIFTHGDPAYDRAGAGVLVSRDLNDGAEARLSLGWEARDRGDGVYVGLGWTGTL